MPHICKMEIVTNAFGEASGKNNNFNQITLDKWEEMSI